MEDQNDLDRIRLQIQDADNLIALQQRIIDRLIIAGQSTALADKLMAKMQAGKAARQRRLQEMLAELNSN